MLSFQELIFRLQSFWADKGCVILQPYDVEVGAGTSHPATALKAIGKDHWRAAYVQPSRRPQDGRYGENPSRTQHYYQFQVILKPAPNEGQKIYLESLDAIGLSSKEHDIRFIEGDWENPSLGASGLGWEVWCDGLEISQFTYFQFVGGVACNPVSMELTYGLERIAAFLQNVDDNFSINWNGLNGKEKITYQDVFLRSEKEFCAYNFEYANTDNLLIQFANHEKESKNLLEHNLVYPAYEQCVKANHIFNLLEARGVISTTERTGYITRVRALAKACCEFLANK